MRRQALERPAIVRSAPVPAGTVFWFWGRPLRVVGTKGEDAAAPVIVEELTAIGDALAGQYGLWSLADVRRAITSGTAKAPRSSTVIEMPMKRDRR